MPELPAPAAQEETARITRIPLVAVLVYAVFAGLWILLSDQLIAWLFPEPAALALAGTVKGMAFVTVTSLLLYLLLRRQAGDASADPSMRRPGWPVVVLGAAIIALSAAGVLRDYQNHRNAAVERLQTIANLKSGQIGDWLAERHREAVFIATSRYYPDLFLRWQKGSDAAAGQELQDRLRHFLSARGFSDASLLAPDGRIIWSTRRQEQPPSAALQAALRAALGARQAARSDPYIQAKEAPVLDYVVPLDDGAAVHGAVVLHARLDSWLYPTLQSWPVPSISGEVLLVRRDGDKVVFLNDLRHSRGAALRLHRPLADSQLPAAKVLRGDARPGEAVAGRDYRGVTVLGVVRAIPDTDWSLVAKIDRAELLGPVLQSAAWISLAGLLALVMLAGSQALLRQRGQLVVAEGIRESQAERLRALRLLAAIADSSDDAIFAKDLDGRYILYNRAACEFVGKPAVAVLGRDDRDLFPAAQASQLMETGRRVVAENRAFTEEETLTTHAGERVFLATKAPLHDEAGHIIGIYGISRDITERKQAEAAQQRLADDLSATLQAIPDLLFELDAQGRYLRIKASREELLAAPQEHLLGHSVDDAMPEAAARTVMDALAEAARTGADYGRVIELPLAIGTRWFELSVSRKDGVPGKPQHFIVLSRDITERHQAEVAIKQQAEELKARNDELERFNRATVGRELDVIEMKKQINALSRELGRARPYPLAFEQDAEEQE
jgi:PAS domain S-box-containing protein